MPIVRKGFATGFCTRDAAFIMGGNASDYRAVTDTIVIQVNLDDLFTGANENTMDAGWAATIDGYLDWALHNVGPSGKPINVVLRSYGGFYAPQFMRNAVGTLTWYSNNGIPTFGAGRVGPEAPSTIPNPPNGTHAFQYLPGTINWTDPAAWDIYANISQALANRWGSHPSIREFDGGFYPMTQFNEPNNHQLGVAENLALLSGVSSYSRANEDAAFMRSWSDALAIWGKPHGVQIFNAFNPRGYTSGSGASFKWNNARGDAAGMQDTYDQIDLFIATVDKQYIILGNKSFDASYQDAAATNVTEKMMWDYMATKRSLDYPVAFQTATLTKMNGSGYTVRQTVDALIALGAHRIELPVGAQSPSAGQDYVGGPYATTYSPLVAAQAPIVLAADIAAPLTQDSTLAVSAETDAPPVGGGGSASVVGFLTGSSGSSTNLTAVGTLPTGIPDGSTLLVLTSAASTVTLTSLSGVSGAQTIPPGAGSPDKNGTNMPTYVLAVAVGAADSGASVTATWSAAARIGLVGVVLSGVLTPAVTMALMTGDGGTFGVVADQGSITVELVSCHMGAASAGAVPTLTMPTAYTSAATTATSTGGTNLTLALGVGTGVGGGTFTSSPAALVDKSTGYAVSFAAAATSTVYTASAHRTQLAVVTVGGLVRRLVPAFVLLAQDATLTADATTLSAPVFADATLTQSSTVTSNWLRIFTIGSVALAQSSTLVAAAVVSAAPSLAAAAALTQSSTVAVGAARGVAVAAALTQSSTRSASAVRSISAFAALTQSSTRSVSALVGAAPVVSAFAALTQGSTSSTSALVSAAPLVSASASLSQVASVLVGGVVVRVGGIGADLVATSTLSASLVRSMSASAMLTQSSTTSTSTTRSQLARASLTQSSIATCASARGAFAGAGLSQSATLSASAVTTGPGGASLVQSSTLSASASTTSSLLVTLVQLSTASSMATLSRLMSAALTQSSTSSTSSSATRYSLASLTQPSVLSLVVLSQLSALVELTQLDVMSATASRSAVTDGVPVRSPRGALSVAAMSGALTVPTSRAELL